MRLSRRLAVCILVLFVLVLQAGAEKVGEPPTAEVSTPSATPVEQYQTLIDCLASQAMAGREPGTPGIEAARDMIVEQFKQAGLKPAFGDSYLQPLKMRLGVEATEQTLAARLGEGEAETAKAGADFSVMGFSANGKFDGPAVFVGYGVTDQKHDYDSYAGLGRDGLAGKVAVAFRYEPQDADGKSKWGKGAWTQSAALFAKARWAVDHGAAALLLVNPPSQDKDKTLRGTDEMVFGQAVGIPVIQVTSDWAGRLLTQAGLDANELQATADAGTDKPTPLAGVQIRGAVKLRERTGMVQNVAAVIPGAGKLADQWVIVGAHYDHVGTSGGKVFAGADDNASGTAGVIMMARRLAAADDKDQPADRRGVILATFTGEERGLIGSRYMADHLDELGIKAEQVAAMINLDMIGRMNGKRLYVLGSDSSKGWADVLPAANAKLGDEKLDLHFGGSGFGPSDHASFYRIKLPVIHIITGMHRDAHSPRDTADRINSAGAMRTVAFAEQVLSAMRTSPEKLAWVAPKRDPRGGGSAYLGISPDPTSAAEGDGLTVSAVMAGGPADKAGLKDGDVITSWNGEPVHNLEDVLARTAKHKPGQVVTLGIRRGDEKLELKVTLGSR